ncbi:hypothetical protein L6164_032332 [Bauhinia variegata]|uniref:Uncharacterized protein n=1 Tax=Bauhinia variegata TaxID=167791 RepID=A0ACB9KNS8_BAUVA|nr:hypothetical protein L6164_032332 [Bauhinia variegata]
MVEQKEVTMRLKVDLQCCKCYKKVKKVLCKFPQIREQMFDEKNGIVTIKVVCCDPEKLRDKLCCKGRGCIESIEIVEPKPEKREEQEEPKKTKPATELEVTVRICCGPCSEGRRGGPCYEGCVMPERKPAPPPVRHPYPPPCVPVGTCCGPCSEGRPGGPCYEGCGRLICYGGYYGWAVYDSYGGRRPCHVSRCDQE